MESILCPLVQELVAFATSLEVQLAKSKINISIQKTHSLSAFQADIIYSTIETLNKGRIEGETMKAIVQEIGAPG